MKLESCAVLLSACLLVSACATPPTPPDVVAADARGSAPAGFVNKVWSVRTSTSVAPGTLYVFLVDGTLLITSSTGTPALGKWTHSGGVFTMIEEGVPYKVDILSLSRDEFRIRSNNPGAPVEMTLVPAETPPLTP
jgi:hypothetical protein